MQEKISAARQAMASRRRVTFGSAYIRDVLAGVQSDFDKQLIHAIKLGAGTAGRLKKMREADPKRLREVLAGKLRELAAEKKDLPKNARL